MAVVGPPRHPIQTTLPPWSRFQVSSSGRRFIELDARGGPVSAVTHQELFPHGETISLMCSAEVKGTLRRGSGSYEGLGVAVQAYVRDNSSNGLRRVWQQRPDLLGDPKLWVTGSYSNWEKVNFVVQMPDGITPDYVRVSWIVRGNGGQVRLTNFEVRDFYARTYDTLIPAARYTDMFPRGRQLAPGFITGSDQSELQRNSTSAVNSDIVARYFDSHFARIAKGQPIEVHLRGEVRGTSWLDNNISPNSHTIGLALKLRREKDGGADWVKAPIPGGFITNHEGPIDFSVRSVALNGYNLIEPIVYMQPKLLNAYSNVRQIQFDHLGLFMKITISDAVESGSTA